MRLTHIRNVETFTASLLSLTLLLGMMPTASRAVGTSRPTSESKNTRAPKQAIEKSLTQLPSVFEESAGQAGGRVKFISRGARHTLALGVEGVTLALLKGGGKEGSGSASNGRAPGENASSRRAPEPSYQLVNMRFVGANPRAEVLGEGALAGRVNYFVGRDTSKWRSNLRTFKGVRYRELYPGVDLVFHGGSDGTQLEYDFVLAPGADPRNVRLRFEGADRIGLGKDGELLLHTKEGTITQSAPVVYQQINGERRAVEGGYVLSGRREIGFRVGAYDPTHALVIDPVLVYSTYFLNANSMAVDDAGAVYVVGSASSFYPDYPITPGAYQQTRRGRNDAFVAKLDASGSGFSYVTYLGGNGSPQSGIEEEGKSIAIDAAGNAYVVGRTSSPDFPVVNAFQTSYAGIADSFITKLNATGSALVYSSYLGGKFEDMSGNVALDAAGAAYMVGITNSTDFPVKNALQPQRNGFTYDFYVTKVAPDGRSLEYSTYLGGTGFELGSLADIAVDATGAAYVGGATDSGDYPVTPGAFQETAKTDEFGIRHVEAVVTKIAPGGAAIVYSTYIGGSLTDYTFGIALDALGQAHLVGYTNSIDFPTRNALAPTARDPYTNGYIVKLNAAGTALVYSTYLSGTPKRLCGSADVISFNSCSGEFASAVVTDAAGNAYVTGNTISGDFPPTAGALQPNLKGYSDAYVLKLSPTGQALWGTYLGGNSFDTGSDIKLGPGGLIYVLGNAPSDDFPTINPLHEGHVMDYTQPFGHFLVKFSEADPSAQTSQVRFDSTTFNVVESARTAQIGVTRTGDLSGEVSVDYSTSDGAATDRSDYTTARGTLRFAPGEAAKSFQISLTDDQKIEGDEWLALTLHDLRGNAVYVAPASAQLILKDDDEHPGMTNPIDDSSYFVRQHYLDFLGREPDDEGLQFWTNEIEQCNTDAQCREVKRINVSAAFFLSIEFQATGFLVERVNRLAYERRVPYRSFAKEARELGKDVIVGQGNWQQQLDANRRAYAEEFTATTAFREEFPASLTPAQYVERLNTRAAGALSTSEFAALVAGLETGTETRGSVLLKVADDEDFRRGEFAPAFVLMQYLGYLRRDPDEEGYNFWLAKLNQFNGDFVRAEMVKAFITSDEYRRRFHEPQKESALSTPFTLLSGETAVVQPDKLRVTLLDVGLDTRCDSGSDCTTPGSISILVDAVNPSGETARFLLTIPGGAPRPFPAKTPVSALGYTFRLLQLDPQPPYPFNPAPTYQATLQVDKN
ncbi:MAG TPA: SBBP repeat-containing protein [Pyrinomonadaceae bacterium]